MIVAIVPGRALQFAIRLEDEPSSWIVDLEDPRSIPDIVISLTEPLESAVVGVGIYWSAPPFQDWEYLGLLTNGRPSDLFSTGWSFNPEMWKHPIIRIGMKLEPSEGLMEKISIKPPIDTKMVYVRKIALNLFRYIESFGGRADQSTLDSWFRRFEEKYKLDPNFILHTE
ncbi:hypothetical protein IE077_001487 [Cardiosporidium cionae]|uniref:Hikeshi-like domain-containing protein n=1 Tax=Cardiosporidium cionae TaxID=476202 RepID=A0ABQ7JD88_9APIC|nr:hypothetical protein IE077_001487 [Cardiosporidium cionae]|eukprot:KAF8821834.1 hypothetical protein IE077_001487 [Cardiosporidium cionae]